MWEPENYREMDGMFAPEILVGDFADVGRTGGGRPADL